LPTGLLTNLHNVTVCDVGLFLVSSHPTSGLVFWQQGCQRISAMQQFVHVLHVHTSILCMLCTNMCTYSISIYLGIGTSFSLVVQVQHGCYTMVVPLSPFFVPGVCSRCVRRWGISALSSVCMFTRPHRTSWEVIMFCFGGPTWACDSSNTTRNVTMIPIYFDSQIWFGEVFASRCRACVFSHAERSWEASD